MSTDTLASAVGLIGVFISIFASAFHFLARRHSLSYGDIELRLDASRALMRATMAKLEQQNTELRQREIDAADPSERPFLRMINEHRGSVGPMLVFADYLEERGQCERAETLRQQAARMTDPNDPKRMVQPRELAY